jgi:hypothetical protein
MLSKNISILIPIDEELPEIIHSFSLKENLIMLKIGSECIIEAKKYITNLTQEEIYNKLKDDSLENIKKLEMDVIFQKELTKQMKLLEKERTDFEIQRTSDIYKDKENQLNVKIDKLQETILLLKEELNQYKNHKDIIIHQELSKEREKYDLIISEKNKQLSRLNDSFEKITNKTNSTKGIDGEKTFSDFANTFRDFKGFEIIDKTKQSGEGDFHLKFEEFNILADAKNYKKTIPSSEREKIKIDLIKNDHIHFAWLVSLNTNIDKYDKSPIMYEWINTNKCIIYINHLLQFENPSQILRIVWFTCKELFKMIKEDNTDINELTSLREKQYKMTDKIKNIRKIIRELNTTIGQFKKQVDSVDYELKDILETETTELIDSNYSIFDDWWEKIILITGNQSDIILSTDLWYKFRQENKDIIKQFTITPDKFKQFIKSKLPMSSYNIRSNNGAFDIKGIKLKE